jgi:biotin-(acetyl-CoA carboxylase) ligase
MKKLFFIKETHSTNSLLREMLKDKALAEKTVVYTNFQTAGRGQTEIIGNRKKGKICFSVFCYIHIIFQLKINLFCRKLYALA